MEFLGWLLLILAIGGIVAWIAVVSEILDNREAAPLPRATPRPTPIADIIPETKEVELDPLGGGYWPLQPKGISPTPIKPTPPLPVPVQLPPPRPVPTSQPTPLTPPPRPKPFTLPPLSPLPVPVQLPAPGTCSDPIFWHYDVRDWWDFEIAVLLLFEHRGFKIDKWTYVLDGGIDGHVEKNGFVGGIQCKHYHGEKCVDVRDVKAFLLALQRWKMAFGFFVATGRISENACRLARTSQFPRIYIVDEAMLCDRGKVFSISAEDIRHAKLRFKLPEIPPKIIKRYQRRKTYPAAMGLRLEPETGYITRRGERYHLPWCWVLNRYSAKPMSVSGAVSSGHSPCLVCQP